MGARGLGRRGEPESLVRGNEGMLAGRQKTVLRVQMMVTGCLADYS